MEHRLHWFIKSLRYYGSSIQYTPPTNKNTPLIQANPAVLAETGWTVMHMWDEPARDIKLNYLGGTA